MSTPYVGFGNDTLGKLPAAKAGGMILCPHCRAQHELKGGTENGKPTELLLFYKCGEKSYLGAVAGRLVINQPADVSGSL